VIRGTKGSEVKPVKSNQTNSRKREEREGNSKQKALENTFPRVSTYCHQKNGGAEAVFYFFVLYLVSFVITFHLQLADLSCFFFFPTRDLCFVTV
jgi:hypothetical protein